MTIATNKNLSISDYLILKLFSDDTETGKGNNDNNELKQQLSLANDSIAKYKDHFAVQFKEIEKIKDESIKKSKVNETLKSEIVASNKIKNDLEKKVKGLYIENEDLNLKINELQEIQNIAFLLSSEINRADGITVIDEVMAKAHPSIKKHSLKILELSKKFI